MGDDTIKDHNKIEQFVFIGHALRTIKLVLKILNLSVFVAIVFYSFCRQVSKIMKAKSMDGNHFLDHTSNESFLNYYKFDTEEKIKIHQLIVLVYWSFTTLTTVGFGDYSPRSETERLFTVLVFLAGVSMFSYIMGNFIEMLQNITYLLKEYEEDESLSMFLSMLEWFN